MKYIVVLGDGMADRPIESLGNKTPLEYAKTPTMDKLASMGEIGMVHTVPCWLTIRENIIPAVLRSKR